MEEEYLYRKESWKSAMTYDTQPETACLPSMQQNTAVVQRGLIINEKNVWHILGQHSVTASWSTF